MRIPQTDNPEKYMGFYIIDFGEQCSIGYTAAEVALLLESEKYADVKVYKIHRAQPDGTLELRGTSRESFFQESGMFFHYHREETGDNQFQALLDWSRQQPPPCRTALQLVKRSDNEFLLALIYPAEYEQEVGEWIRQGTLPARGPVDAGISQVSRFYAEKTVPLRQEQLWPDQSQTERTRDQEELLASIAKACQR